MLQFIALGSYQVSYIYGMLLRYLYRSFGVMLTNKPYRWEIEFKKIREEIEYEEELKKRRK